MFPLLRVGQNNIRNSSWEEKQNTKHSLDFDFIQNEDKLDTFDQSGVK